MITQEMKAIAEVCRRFGASAVSSGALEADLSADTQWANSIWNKSTELGLPALLLPEALGGAGQEAPCAALVLDALAAECAGVASLFLHHYTACTGVLWGDPAQNGLFSKRLQNVTDSSPKIAGVIFPNEDDATRLRLEIHKGSLRLSGKSPLTASASLAGTFIIFVLEDDAGNSYSCLWVDKDAPGISIGANARLPGLKVNPFCSIGFDGVDIPETCFIGRRGDAYALYRRTLDLYFGLVAACSIGAARTAYRRAFSYARERFQYGKFIIQHQEMQRLLGNMHNKIAVGTAVYKAAFAQEDEGGQAPRLDGRAAKVFCTDAALEIALDAVQIHGGYGYMHDYYVEKIMRDVKVLQLLGGSSPALNIESIREQLLMKGE